MTSLPRLGSKLLEITGRPGPGYRKLYLMVLDGMFPTQVRNGRIFVLDSDLPAVVAALDRGIAT
jgi:hypothetical protein